MDTGEYQIDEVVFIRLTRICLLIPQSKLVILVKQITHASTEVLTGFEWIGMIICSGKHGGEFFGVGDLHFATMRLALQREVT
jgi:hypothetical protein